MLLAPKYTVAKTFRFPRSGPVVHEYAAFAVAEENLGGRKERRMNIYVGNLSDEVIDEDLQAAFASYGEVTSARVIKDRFSGRSRGFGFVEMSDKAQAQAAIDDLNGKDFKGRAIVVNEARPRGGSGGQQRGGARGRRGGPHW
jgi:RNA recognition motif-containing protein